jgi:hypothetical protein
MRLALKERIGSYWGHCGLIPDRLALRSTSSLVFRPANYIMDASHFSSFIGVFIMSRNNNRNRRKYTRNEKIFYVLSILIIVSMVLGTVAVSLGSSF